jgi:uncharacterized damage-inducible protein DinB
MSEAILPDLVRHKWYANAAYLGAVYRNEATRHDEELRTLFLHILVANRYWLLLTLGREFDRDKETLAPASIEALVNICKETEALEMGWLTRCDEHELARPLVTPHLPGSSFTVSQALMQVCLHSHGHRVQSAARLRSLGAAPPPTDFILWVKERPVPDWTFLRQ